MIANPSSSKLLTNALRGGVTAALVAVLCVPAMAFADDMSPVIAEGADVDNTLVAQVTMEPMTDKTAIDWFESRGSKTAVSAILNSSLSSYTNVGSPTDATNLDNMKRSLEWIMTFNERYRTGLGLVPLKVSDTMMAYAIADANYSDSNIGHARVFNCGENLAWGYADPYKGWYDAEKALYDAGNRNMSEIGHYLNIINPSYRSTGYAINLNRSKFSNTHSQTFGFDMPGAVSADTYYAQFMAYYAAAVSGSEPIKDEPAGSMFRMFNPATQEHLYTADTNERATLVAGGWRYEGVAWKAPEKSSTPVYRLYNAGSHEHHYTTDTDEREALLAGGWNDEGIGWYSDDAKGVALYRLFNPKAGIGAHHYTKDANERATLLADGWSDEDVAWYGVK